MLGEQLEQALLDQRVEKAFDRDHGRGRWRNAAAASRIEEGEARDGTAAIDAMDFITGTPEIDPCDPIMLTGKTVLVDDDLLPNFLGFAGLFFACLMCE